MVLGDNIFFGHGLPRLMARADEQDGGGTVFGYHVADPERYGVVAFDAAGAVREIIEKPAGAAVELRGDGALFPGWIGARTGARGDAVGPGRAGDHLAVGNVPGRPGC